MQLSAARRVRLALAVRCAASRRAHRVIGRALYALQIDRQSVDRALERLNPPGQREPRFGLRRRRRAIV